jgi:RNA polymerase sigma factor (sigma-70 family)
MKDVPAEERLRRLYEAAWRPVLAYALRRTPSADEAADILMETFTIAWVHLSEVPEGDSAVLWLYATARGAIANATRRQQRRLRLSERAATELNRAAPAEADAAPAHEDALVATAALGLLDDEDRELLMLAAWEGLGSHELGRLALQHAEFHTASKPSMGSSWSYRAGPQPRSAREWQRAMPALRRRPA